MAFIEPNRGTLYSPYSFISYSVSDTMISIPNWLCYGGKNIVKPLEKLESWA